MGERIDASVSGTVGLNPFPWLMALAAVMALYRIAAALESMADHECHEPVAVEEAP